MTPADIINAYVRIRKIDNTIPDDVLDLMKDAAIEQLAETQDVDLPNEVPVLDMTDKQRKDLCEKTMEIAAKPLLMTYKMCGLKTHMECSIYNEPTDEFFKLSFTKVNQNKK